MPAKYAGVTDMGVLEQRLIRAAKEGDVYAVKGLLFMGVDLHASNDEAFSVASKARHLGVERILLEYGARARLFESVTFRDKNA
jgi:hypothetical protein